VTSQSENPGSVVLGSASVSLDVETASPVNGACGNANSVAVSAAPATGLCNPGTASAISGSGPWSWSCSGSNGGTTASCDAPVETTATPPACSGTCYYVSNTGNDSNAGTSTSAPWQTIGKVVSEQANFKPGTDILFQAGGVWEEELDITNMNGSSSSPITIGSYGSGAMPVIDGGQTSSTNGRNYCIDAINTNFKWITINGIECRNAYLQGITFQAYSGTGTNGVGVVVENSYVHHDGIGACTTCGSTPAADSGQYANQLDAQVTTGVQFLSNTIDHCGGHNCLEVHYDFGSPIVEGNIVGTAAPYCNHNCIDQKGVVGGQFTNNIVTCPACGSDTAAFYTENGGSDQATEAETVTYTGNISYNVPVGFQVQNGGTCPSGPCSINANFYNNTAYNSSNLLFYDNSCTPAPHTLDLEKNIWDGGNVTIGSACVTTWNYNDDGGVAPITGNPVGSQDLSNINPQYVNASSGNFTPQNSTVLTYGSGDSVTSFAYLGAK
jgi:hypothetical protein